MSRKIASRAAPLALAVAMTLAMLGATNALANHQYRVAAAVGAQASHEMVRVTAAGQAAADA